MNPSAHSGVRVSSTSPTSLYFIVHADEEDRTDSMFDMASVEQYQKNPQDYSPSLFLGG